MRIFSFRDRRPLTKLELIIVVLVACITVLFVHKRVERLTAESEHTAMILTIKSLRYAVMAQAMQYVLEGRQEDLAAMPGSNPMKYATPPKNYAGEKIRVGKPRTWTGIWYFDPERNVLIYRASHQQRFQSSGQSPDTAYFAISTGGEQGGLPEFVVLTPFKWTME